MEDFDYIKYLKSNPLFESKESEQWDSLDDDKRMDLLLTVIKDPDEAERFLSFKWSNLPSEISSYIKFDVKEENKSKDSSERLTNLILQSLKEMSISGPAGTAGASNTAGTGEQYSSKLFKKKK